MFLVDFRDWQVLENVTGISFKMFITPLAIVAKEPVSWCGFNKNWFLSQIGSKKY